MLNDEDTKETKLEIDHTATETHADRNDDGSAMTTEQVNKVADVQSMVADILKDAEDDLYGRDGNTNDSDLAGQRLQAMAGRLVGAFAQVASGLSLVVEAAKQKIENAEKNDALTEFQNQQEKKKQEEAEKTQDSLEEALDENENIRKLEREREEWSRTSHSYAGIEMTGEEWGEFADKLKGDTPLRKALLEKLKKEGKTDAKAIEMADQMALLARMQSLPPSQWTPEMKALDPKLNADPELRQDLNKRLIEEQNFDATMQANGQKIEQVAEISKAQLTDSTAQRADMLAQSSGSPLEHVPQKLTSHAANVRNPAIETKLDLGEHHRAALEAKEPLDAPKQIASFTPTIPAPASPGAGFDA